MGLLDSLEIETQPNPIASVVWLHGLGADGSDFEPIVPELRMPETLPVRFVFPHAPERPVTINQGMVMRAWYDITGFELERREDDAGVRDSAQQVNLLIQREQDRGVPCSRIVLAGFSQGGAVALHAGLRFPETLAGIMALSAYLPLADTVQAEATQANRSTPIFMAHGTLDPVVPIQMGKLSFDFLEREGFNPSWKDYPMPHAVCPEEIADIGVWLQSRLA
jgi:phospholipase/carboxylesterase